MPVNRYYSSTAVDTTLAVGISASDTSITLASTTGFPTSYPYTLAVDYDTSLEELVNVVGASGTTLTIGTTVGVADISGRGVDQGAGYRFPHNAGAVVKHVISGRDVREPQEHIAASTNVHGIADTSALVTATSTTTLINKSLTAPTITGIANVTSATLALGTAGTITANSTTITAAELGYLDGATSNLQNQITAKAPTASPTFTGTVTIPTGAQIANPTIAAATLSGTTTNSGTISGGTVTGATVTSSSLTSPTVTGTANITGGTLALGTTGSVTANGATVTAEQLGYVSGATSNIQSQIAALGNWQDYTSTWAGTSMNYGTGATASARYVQIGKTVHFKAKITLGTSPSISSSTPTFTLPNNPNDAFINISGYYQGSVSNIALVARTTSGSSTASIYSVTTNAYTTSATAYTRFGGTGGITSALSSHGITPASGDIIFVSGTYEVA